MIVSNFMAGAEVDRDLGTIVLKTDPSKFTELKVPAAIAEVVHLNFMVINLPE